MTEVARHLALALTGASGAPYFLRMLSRLRGYPGLRLHVLFSDGGKRVLAEECKLKPSDLDLGDCAVYDNRNIGACLASGSFPLESLVILPCSQNTLCAMAAGLAGNLIQRAAAVQLKERRRLIIVPRETPLSLIALRAMVTMAEAGAVVMPASPGFYHQPQSIDDLLDSVVDRVIDLSGLHDPSIKRWNP